MLAGLAKLRRRIATDQRGAAMLEFAIALPILAFLMMILVDSSRGFATKLKMENASARTLEKVSAISAAGSDFEPLRLEAAAAAEQPVTNVTLDTWLECAGVRRASFDDVCAAGEEIARYLSISVFADYRPMFNAEAIASAYGGRGMGEVVRVTGDAQMRLQ